MSKKEKHKLYVFVDKITKNPVMYSETRRPDTIWLWFYNVREVPAYAINVYLKG